MIMEELAEYKNPKTKLGRLVKEGVYTPITRGLYETNSKTPGYLLAGSIYGPSYLSFEFALSYYGMIPEAVQVYTCATFDKKKRRIHNTYFGIFSYRDVPVNVYPLGVTFAKEGEYIFQIATKEKALCDKLYTMKVASNQNELRAMILDNLRIDIDEIRKLDEHQLKKIAEAYHSTNVTLLHKIYKREIKNR